MVKSSTQEIPETRRVPRHIAIIMDGNGRWAQRSFLPRIGGHKRGVEAVRNVVRACGERGVEYLTLFAFSSENWRRPPDEVSFLMRLFVMALEQEVGKLHENGVRFRVIGDLSRFEPKLASLIREAEGLTRDNRGLTLTVAANYGGRWDILQATNRMLKDRPELASGFGEDDLKLAQKENLQYANDPNRSFSLTLTSDPVSTILMNAVSLISMFARGKRNPYAQAETMPQGPCHSLYAWDITFCMDSQKTFRLGKIIKFRYREETQVGLIATNTWVNPATGAATVLPLTYHAGSFSALLEASGVYNTPFEVTTVVCDGWMTETLESEVSQSFEGSITVPGSTGSMRYFDGAGQLFFDNGKAHNMLVAG